MDDSLLKMTKIMNDPLLDELLATADPDFYTKHLLLRLIQTNRVRLVKTDGHIQIEIIGSSEDPVSFDQLRHAPIPNPRSPWDDAGRSKYPHWTLTTFMLHGQSCVITDSEHRPMTLIMDESYQEVNGWSGCNSYWTYYIYAGSQISFSNALASTYRAGSESAMRLEHDYQETLRRVTTRYPQGEHLTLVADAGKTRLEFVLYPVLDRWRDSERPSKHDGSLDVRSFHHLPTIVPDTIEQILAALQPVTSVDTLIDQYLRGDSPVITDIIQSRREQKGFRGLHVFNSGLLELIENIAYLRRYREITGENAEG
jgi:heat shock protein HslJ